MMELKIPAAMRPLMVDVFCDRETGVGSILAEHGVKNDDALEILLDGIRAGKVAANDDLAALLINEADYYGELWEDRRLMNLSKKLREQVEIAKGLRKAEPKKPRRKAGDNPRRVVMAPTKIHDGPFRLRPPEGANRYCGPTAIAALMKTTTDNVARIARRISGRRAIRAMYPKEAIATVIGLGGRVIGHDGHAGMTLEAWQQDMARRIDLSGAKFLVMVTGHFVAVHGDDVLCSMQEGRAARHIAYAESRRKKVLKVWQIL